MVAIAALEYSQAALWTQVQMVGKASLRESSPPQDLRQVGETEWQSQVKNAVSWARWAAWNPSSATHMLYDFQEVSQHPSVFLHVR